MSVDTMNGSRFVSFYNVKKCPFICILDPRTAGNQKTINITHKINAKQIIIELYEFIKINGSFPESSEPKNENGHYPVDIPVHIMPEDFTEFVEVPIQSTSTTSTDGKLLKINMPEEEQIKLAIEYSLAIVISDSDDSEDECVEIVSKGEIEASDECTLDYKKFLGDENDIMTNLLCRFPEDKKILLKWPVTSKFKALKLYLKEECHELIKEPYKIIMTHPTRNLSLEPDDSTLKQLGLHPSATLFIQPDD